MIPKLYLYEEINMYLGLFYIDITFIVHLHLIYIFTYDPYLYNISHLTFLSIKFKVEFLDNQSLPN